MARQATWWMMAGVVVAVLFRPAPALAAPAPLVTLMERCTPPIGGIDDASKGYGNYAADPSGKSGNWTRSVKVRFAWAYDGGAETEQEAINATHRLDVCEIFRALPTATDPGGEAQVYCPGWHGHSAWVSGAPAAKYVSTLAEATAAGGTASESSITVPFDWDLLYANGPALFVLVVNADHEPTFEEIKNTIPTSGFCGAPTRIASKLDGDPLKVAGAVPSLPGQQNALGWVAYGIPYGSFTLPTDWTYGDVCNDAAYTAKALTYSHDPCVHQGAVLFAMDRLNEINSWQLTDVQGGLFSRLDTAQNGSGGDTCKPGETCPTRFTFTPNGTNAGFGWGSARPASQRLPGWGDLIVVGGEM